MYYGDLRANSGKVPHSRAHWCWELLMISVHYGWLLNQWPPEYWPTSRSEAVEHCSVFCQEQKELCKIKWAPGWTAVTASSGLNGLRFDRTDWVIQKPKFVMRLAILSQYKFGFNNSSAHTYIHIIITSFSQLFSKWHYIVTPVGGDNWLDLMRDSFKIADSFREESNESCYKSLNWFARNTESFSYKLVA